MDRHDGQVAFLGCTQMKSCALFPIMKSRDGLKIWKQRYCEHDEGHKKCARYKLAGAGELVPLSLLPNGKLLGQ